MDHQKFSLFERILSQGFFIVAAVAGFSAGTASIVVFADDAFQVGYRDGKEKGGPKGEVDGRTEGRREGETRGEREGYAQCEEKERRREYNRGYQSGENEGESRGRAEGISQGHSQGTNAGDREGTADGTARADSESAAAANPVGARLGYDQANASDAAVLGRKNGLIDGDSSAQEKALDFDFKRGRHTLYDERFAEAIRFEQVIDQALDATNASSGLSSVLFGQKFHLASTGFEAAAYFEPSVTAGYCDQLQPPNPSCAQQYTAGFQKGYHEAHTEAYKPAHARAYNSAYPDAYRMACQRATSAYYPESRELGRKRGFEEGYARTFRPSYDSAYQEAYRQRFQVSSRDAYHAHYQGFYQRHLESSRSRAYRVRYQALYDAAYKPAFDQKYSEVYPGYAEIQYRRGREVEAADFTNRPVRLLSVQTEEHIEDGIIEVGERVRLTLGLRNFSDAVVSGRDISLKILAQNQAGVVLLKDQMALREDLRPKSRARVVHAFEFKFAELALDKIQTLEVQVFYKGALAGSQSWQLIPSRLIAIQMEPLPEFRLGYEGVLKFHIKNQSQKALSEPLFLNLKPALEGISIANTTQTLAELQAGEEKVISFSFKNNMLTQGQDTDFILEGTFASRGRVGLYAKRLAVAVPQDYKIFLRRENLDALRKKGKTRVRFSVQNISNRAVTETLQITGRFEGENKNIFYFRDANPLFFAPLASGKTFDENFKVTARQKNTGGKFILELREGGRLLGFWEEHF